MKKLEILKFFTLLVLVLTFISCNDSDVELEVTGEVFTIKKVIDGNIKYAASYFAYGNQEMSSVVVNLPNSSSVTLESGGSQGITFYKEPETDDFQTSIVSSGTYEFVITKDEEKYTVTESHIFEDLAIPTISNLDVNYSSYSIDVEWENAEDSDSYLVRIFDENKESVYIGYLLSNSVSSFTVNNSAGTWDQSLESGSTYTLEVQSMTYEATATSSDYYYHIQTVAIGAMDFVWEE